MKSSELEMNINLNLIERTKENPTLLSLIQLAPIIKKGVVDFYKQSKEDLINLKEDIRTKLIETSFPYNEINDENKKDIKKCLSI